MSSAADLERPGKKPGMASNPSLKASGVEFLVSFPELLKESRQPLPMPGIKSARFLAKSTVGSKTRSREQETSFQTRLTPLKDSSISSSTGPIFHCHISAFQVRSIHLTGLMAVFLLSVLSGTLKPCQAA